MDPTKFRISPSAPRLVLVGVQLRVLCKYLGTDMVGVVVASGNASGSEVWDIVQSASAQYTLVPYSNDDHTFSFPLRKVGSIPFAEKKYADRDLNSPSCVSREYPHCLFPL